MEVLQTFIDGKDRFGYIFQASDRFGTIHTHQSNITIERSLYEVGDVVDGRVSAVTGRVLSTTLVAHNFSGGTLLTFIGAYLGRRVIFRPLGYGLGLLVGLLIRVFSAFKKRLNGR